MEPANRSRNRIYIQPVGGFKSDVHPPLDKLSDYVEVFFSMDAKILEPVDSTGLTTRKNPHTGNEQILTRDVLNLLLEGCRKMPIASLGSP